MLLRNEPELSGEATPVGRTRWHLVQQLLQVNEKGGLSIKILALEKQVPCITEEEFRPHLRAEAARAWELYQAGVIREMYFRQDWPGAVLVLECANAEEASQVLDTLPLVQEGLIVFDVVPLIPYPGLSRLFDQGS